MKVTERSATQSKLMMQETGRSNEAINSKYSPYLRTSTSSRKTRICDVSSAKDHNFGTNQSCWGKTRSTSGEDSEPNSSSDEEESNHSLVVVKFGSSNQIHPAAGPEVFELNMNDVLCGRKSAIHRQHCGNLIYQRIIEANKPLYESCDSRIRPLVAKSIARAFAAKGGRFLKISNGKLVEIGTDAAVSKITRALKKSATRSIS